MHENKKDPMEVDDAIDALNAALRLQQRSAIAYTHTAGTLVGFQFHGLAEEMRGFALAELDDAQAREHRPEHMRKQEQVDALIRASGGPDAQ